MESCNSPLRMVLFVDGDICSRCPFYACVVARLLDHGHHVSLFTHYNDIPVLLLEDPPLPGMHSHLPGIELQERLKHADAVLYITCRHIHQISFSLPKLKTFNGRAFTWEFNGVNCILLGGWINNRTVAIKVRAILASGDYYPALNRALPTPSYNFNDRKEDMSKETAGPCI